MAAIYEPGNALDNLGGGIPNFPFEDTFDFDLANYFDIPGSPMKATSGTLSHAQSVKDSFDAFFPSQKVQGGVRGQQGLQEYGDVREHAHDDHRYNQHDQQHQHVPQQQMLSIQNFDVGNSGTGWKKRRKNHVRSNSMSAMEGGRIGDFSIVAQQEQLPNRAETYTPTYPMQSTQPLNSLSSALKLPPHPPLDKQESSGSVMSTGSSNSLRCDTFSRSGSDKSIMANENIGRGLTPPPQSASPLPASSSVNRPNDTPQPRGQKSKKGSSSPTPQKRSTPAHYRNEKARGGYSCGLCGEPKKNHVCRYEKPENITIVAIQCEQPHGEEGNFAMGFAKEFKILKPINAPLVDEGIEEEEERFRQFKPRVIIVNRQRTTIQTDPDKILKSSQSDLKLEKEKMQEERKELEEIARENQRREKEIHEMEAKFAERQREFDLLKNEPHSASKKIAEASASLG